MRSSQAGGFSTPGCADLRLAVVSPFVDRRHGTERVLAEVLERLAGKYGYEIHLYAQRVEDLALARSAASSGDEMRRNRLAQGALDS